MRIIFLLRRDWSTETSSSAAVRHLSLNINVMGGTWMDRMGTMRQRVVY
jgi:hypothetical protein